MIKKIDGTGNIQLMAGSGASGYSGDGTPATGAKLNAPGGLAFIGSDLYVAGEAGDRLGMWKETFEC